MILPRIPSARPAPKMEDKSLFLLPSAAEVTHALGGGMSCGAMINRPSSNPFLPYCRQMIFPHPAAPSPCRQHAANI